VIDLGNCLDLLVRENLELLRWSYNDLTIRREAAGLPMPENEDVKSDRNKDKLLRKLDCAVIRNLHSILEDQPPEGYPEVGMYLEPYDTVRGLFPEGDRVYPGGGFYELSHTQIAVRTDACIIGVFRPRDVQR
jgi:hypothetical protein